MNRDLFTTSYLKVNLLIAGIILLMMGYFGFFSLSGINYPISSMYKFDVPSTGLSRAFSAILRFEFDQALTFNPYSIRLFLFFFIQLIFRLVLSVLLLYNRYAKKGVLFFDIMVSVLLFLPSFGKYLIEQIISYYE